MRLDLVVGPNGAGKSTIIERIISPQVTGSVFVNADLITRDLLVPGSDLDAEALAYQAGRIAAKTRAALIAANQLFIAETVFSHESKLDLLDAAHAQDFHVHLHIMIVPVDLAVARVQHRVLAGGHSVPVKKIRARYKRLWPLVAKAIQKADTTTVWNNASHDGPDLAALFSHGVLIGNHTLPLWAPTEILELAT